ncbi:MAG TPA: hypothetical protein VLB50_09345 [Ignavibacteriaceae bacterium]|nr:hypothetical protein [Ignavibacteriaceae bacterium]
MNLYAIALFLHIGGAIGLYVGLGMEGLILRHLGYAETNSQALLWGNSMKIMRIVFGVSSLLLLIPGVYLAEVVWGWTPWVITGLVLLVVLSAYGSVSGKKIAANVFSLSKNNEPIPAETKNNLRDPKHLRFYKMRLPIAAGIIFIMTIKPDLLVSIVSIIVSLIIGIMLSLPAGEKVKELESA